MFGASKADAELVLRAAELARSSPRAWSAFLAEFKQYAGRAKDQCVSSPIETLPVMQGIARGIVGVSELLEHCVFAAEKLAEIRERQVRNT